MADEYMPLPIAELGAGDLAEFDIYMRRGDRYILYRKMSTPITSDNIGALKKNHVSDLWVAPEDLEKYQQFINKKLEKVVDDETISIEEKCEKTLDLSSTIAKWIFDQDFSSDVLNATENIMQSVVKLMFQDRRAAHQLALQSRLFHEFHTHAIHVCVFGLALTHRLLGENKEKLIREIGPGFFFHDIGMLSLPREILERRGRLTQEEMQRIRNHPKIGAEILSNLNLSTDAMKIVLQHHERGDGSGYPFGLREKQISVYARICSLAETFDALNTQQSYRVRHPTFDSLKIIKKEFLDHVGWDLFENFATLFYSPKPNAVIKVG
ncbi:MAG: HD domain-containing protein [Candidatus Omnitrophota bacterium]|jgi:HD-GYP domain-containing protein (c-di-GMP phosphodiesterase class II)|nr:MAG: HD domain-containing protein [Candidatus Omnitrophota bacterium]